MAKRQGQLIDPETNFTRQPDIDCPAFVHSDSRQRLILVVEMPGNITTQEICEIRDLATSYGAIVYGKLYRAAPVVQDVDDLD